MSLEVCREVRRDGFGVLNGLRGLTANVQFMRSSNGPTATTSPSGG